MLLLPPLLPRSWRSPLFRPAVPPRCTAPLYRMQVLKYGAMSANIVTEEPIDMVLHESYPNR